MIEVAAAAQSAISASGLIAARCAAYYGHDPGPYDQQAKARRAALDPYMIAEQQARMRRGDLVRQPHLAL